MRYPEKLFERYPDIGFQLSITTFEPLELAPPTSQEIERSLSKLSLQDIDVLYVYGLALGLHYTALKKWLHARQERALIFIEENLAVIDAFSQMPHAEGLIQDPQAYLCFISSPKRRNAVLEELALQFPTEKVAVIPGASYSSSTFYKLRLALLRNSAAMHALLSDALHAHKLFENLLPNIRRLPDAFNANSLEGSFEGIPAIICGAGPSLSASIGTLKHLEERALIIAGGSAISALSSQGVKPHLAMAFDPNPEEFERLKSHEASDVPLLYGNRLFPKVFETFTGPIGYMRSDTGGAFETWMEEKLGIGGKAIGPELGKEALSVTTLAVAYAYALGCNPIILCGVDLAYTGGLRYAPGVMQDAAVSLSAARSESRALERLMRRKDREGRLVYTTLKWVMESSAIGAYARAHPERVFLNCTEEGIGFPHIPYLALDEALAKYCTKRHPLRAALARKIANLGFSISRERIDELCKELEESLSRLRQICDAFLEELSRIKDVSGTFHPTGKMIILEIDFQEELAFHALLGQLPLALERLMRRYFQKETSEIKKMRTKWEQIKETIIAYERIFACSYAVSAEIKNA